MPASYLTFTILFRALLQPVQEPVGETRLLAQISTRPAVQSPGTILKRGEVVTNALGRRDADSHVLPHSGASTTAVGRLLLQAITLKHTLGHILVSPKGLVFL